MANGPAYKNPAFDMATRCKEVIEGWRGKHVNVDRDGLRLIAEFAYALDVAISINIFKKEDVDEE